MTTTTLTTQGPSHEPVTDSSGTAPREIHHIKWIPFARRRGDGEGRDMLSGAALTVALSSLLALAVGMGYVSYKAQHLYIGQHKSSALAATVEALGLDAGAVIFACLAFAAALSGRAAVRARVGNLACVGGSLAMNLMSANPSSLGSLAVWGMPAALYAFASDTLIGEIRLRALAARGKEDTGSAFVSLGRSLVALLLWVLRLVFDARGTLRGFRTWVLVEVPTAPRRNRDSEPAGELEPPAQQEIRSLPLPGQDTAATEPVRKESAVRTARTTTKRALLQAAYDRLDDNGDPRTGRRECVAELARELAPEVGVNEGTARRYLHEHVAAAAAA